MLRLHLCVGVVLIFVVWPFLLSNAYSGLESATLTTNRSSRRFQELRVWKLRSTLWRHRRNVERLAVGSKKILAIYSARYHRFEKARSGWEDGLVDFRFLRRIRRNRYGHPLVSASEGMGFYDLTSRQQRRYHGELAKKYGIYGFAIYHYWSNGTPEMQAPMELMLEDGQPDIPFSFIWANEHQKVTGDSMSGAERPNNQSYDKNDWKLHFEWLLKFFKHSNYIFFQGCPLVHILHAESISNLKEMTLQWQQWAKLEGFEGIHFAQLNGFKKHTSSYMLQQGMNSIVEYQPHYQHDLHMSFNEILRVENTSTVYFRGVSTSFDNSPQHGKALHSASIKLMHPASFYYWLRQVLAMTKDGGFVYINAWNEWLEGAAIEPTIQMGREWLRAVKRALEDEHLGYFSQLLPDGHPKTIPLRPAGVPLVANSTSMHVCIVVRTFVEQSTGHYNLHQTLNSLLQLEHQKWDAFIVNTDPAPFPHILSILSEYNSTGRFHLTNLQAHKVYEDDNDHPYALLDEAISQYCSSPDFDWILATNGDNWYAPDALNFLDFSQDVILMNFYSRYMGMSSVRRSGRREIDNCCRRLDEDKCVFSNLKMGAVDLGAMIFRAAKFRSERIQFLAVSNVSKAKCPKYGGCHDGALADLLKQQGWSFTSHPIDVCAFYHNSNPTSCDMIGGIWLDSLDPRKVGCYDYKYLEQHLPGVDIEAFRGSKKACLC